MGRPEPECLMELRHGEANTEQQQEAYRILGKFAEYMAKLEAENLQWVRESEIAQARIAECDAEIARLRGSLSEARDMLADDGRFPNAVPAIDAALEVRDAEADFAAAYIRATQLLQSVRDKLKFDANSASGQAADIDDFLTYREEKGK